MRIIENLRQGSPEWHEFRATHIMATDAATILDINPWKTPYELWEQKLGLIVADAENDAMRRGSLLEPEARKIFVEMTGINMTPVVCQSRERAWQAASLDGISDCRKFILEIKCPNLDTHRFACDDGGIKDYYKSQVQHQLCVTNCEKCFYLSYRPESEQKICLLEIFPNEAYIDVMCKIEEEFYECLCEMRMPRQRFLFVKREDD